MKPVDYRDANWMELRGRLQGARQQVYGLLQTHGPCTTRALAAAAGLDVCSVRPRITELVQLGLAEIDGERAGRARSQGEGVYRAVALHVAEEAFAVRCREARTGQLQLF